MSKHPTTVLAYFAVGAGGCSYATGKTTLDALTKLRKVVERDWCVNYRFDAPVLRANIYDLTHADVWDSGDLGVRNSETKEPLPYLGYATFSVTYPKQKRAGK